MADAHPHDHPPGGSRRALGVAAGANTILLVVQVAGALAFGSVALLADSVHQASDVVSLILAVGIAGVVMRPATVRYTFGLGRADALGGLAHAVLLLGGAVVITVEALRRLTGDGHHVEGLGVVVLAAVGLVVNGLSARWLHVGHGHPEGAPGGRSLNVEGAILHLVADALGSLVVLVAGAVVLFTDADWVDPAASLVVTALIVWSAVRLFRSSLEVLLDAVPPGVDVDELRAVLEADPMVSDAHHLHVRSLGGHTLSLTGHVRVASDHLHDAETVTRRLSDALGERGIAHVTLQAECHPCDEPEC